MNFAAAPIKSVLFTNIKKCRGNNSYENRRQTIFYLKISRHWRWHSMMWIHSSCSGPSVHWLAWVAGSRLGWCEVWILNIVNTRRRQLWSLTNSIPVQDCRLVAVAWPVAWTDPGLVTQESPGTMDTGHRQEDQGNTQHSSRTWLNDEFRFSHDLLPWCSWIN